jgi:Putative beta-barrel porin-2, OmpL-like. bbp2
VEAVVIIDPSNPKSEPFAFADFTWLNGNARTKDTPYATKYFTPEIRSDVSYTYDFRHPQDHTIVGSSDVFRANEVTLTDLGIGGNFHVNNLHAHVLSQIGLYATATPRNDASPARGQWELADAYRYVSEANPGYHFNVQHGLNLDAGIFLPTPAYSHFISLITGPISHRMSPRTRSGSSTACACSGFPQPN